MQAQWPGCLGGNTLGLWAQPGVILQNGEFNRREDKFLNGY